jgi:hypothetical protein
MREAKRAALASYDSEILSSIFLFISASPEMYESLTTVEILRLEHSSKYLNFYSSSAMLPGPQLIWMPFFVNS